MTTITSNSESVLPVVAPADYVPQGQWTYSDYVNLPDDGNRYEIINGVLYMTPSPRFSHQQAVVQFVYHLVTHVNQAGLGRVIVAPFNVEIRPDMVVQPDVMVVLNEHLVQITDEKLNGAPDIVIEISSPSTAGYDRREKQNAYAEAGVLEYWIADPVSQTIEVLSLTQNVYSSKGVFSNQALLPTEVLKGLPVKVVQFFA